MIPVYTSLFTSLLGSVKATLMSSNHCSRKLHSSYCSTNLLLKFLKITEDQVWGISAAFIAETYKLK
jgi:hypothetical protein